MEHDHPGGNLGPTRDSRPVGFDFGWKVGRDGNAPIGDLFRFELVSMVGTAKKHIPMLLEGVSDESRQYLRAMSRAFEVIVGGSRSQKRDAHTHITENGSVPIYRVGAGGLLTRTDM
jgi:hypothetical protein